MQFEALLERMYRRDGLEDLPAHLEAAHGIVATKLTRLDAGVFRVDRPAKAPPVVVRVFPADRPYAAAQGDLAVLDYLAETDFPAERPAGPLSEFRGQAVLVTGFVRAVPKAKQPPYPIVRLGARVGRLHGMAVPAGADRPAGALHHFAEGTLADELRAAAGWLDGPGFLVEALLGADGGDGLPEGLVHPDPVPKNAIFTAEGPVLVDWTSAGRGPRLASLALVLRSGWAALPFLKGYSRHVTLSADERERLGGLLFSRALIDVAFRYRRDPGVSLTAAKLTGLRRDCEARAGELLAG